MTAGLADVTDFPGEIPTAGAPLSRYHAWLMSESMGSAPGVILKALFDAERAVRAAHDQLVDTETDDVLPVLEQSVRAALTLDEVDEDEAALRLVRVAALLGEMQGPRVVDLLVDILASDEPEARNAAGEALSGLAFDRFKEVAMGVERALERLQSGSPALSELPYLLVEVPEPGVEKLLARFLAHRDADAVASAIEAFVEIGDPAALPLLDSLAADSRRVQLEDEGGTQGEATIAELVAEARTLLSKGAT
jgi:HEAT repeat protein